MNKTLLNKLNNMLLEERKNLLAQANQEIEIDTDGDETDEIQANMLTNVLKRLNDRNSARLNQVVLALKRIEDGTYGKCQDCDEVIPDKRLLANPIFQTCVGCAEEREAEEKQRRK